MTPAEFKAARHKLGLSANRCAEIFRIGSGRTIRRWEAGTQDIPGPAQILLTLLASGTITLDDIPTA